jgi:hypothetical protein
LPELRLHLADVGIAVASSWGQAMECDKGTLTLILSKVCHYTKMLPLKDETRKYYSGTVLLPFSCVSVSVYNVLLGHVWHCTPSDL